MNFIKSIALFIITLSAPVSCSFSLATSNMDSTSESTSMTSGDIVTSEDGPDIPTTPEYLSFFEPTTKIDIDINIAKDDLVTLEINGMSGDSREDIYLPSSISIDVTTTSGSTNYSFDSVGIRMKGNRSKNTFIDHESGYIYDMIHFKISFDEFVIDQRFLGMSKLDLKWNRNLDDTNIKQVYAYKMFKDYLDLSLDATLATVGITQLDGEQENHTYLGVYTINEAIDKRMLKRIYTPDDSEGNLYKVRYTDKGPADFTKYGAVIQSGSQYSALNNGKIGIEDLDQGYRPSYDLKTNKKTPDYSDMATLIGNIDSSNDYDSDANKLRLDALIDMDTFIKMEAIAYFMGNPDDLRNNFNNAYVYFVPSTGKAIFIPYDFDRAFGMNGNWDPTGNSMTQAGPFSDQSFGYWEDNKSQRNPLYRFTILDGAHPTYRAMYEGYLNDILDSDWLTSTYFEAMYNQYKANYESEVVADNELPYRSFSLTNVSEYNWTFDDYINAKINTTINDL